MAQDQKTLNPVVSDAINLVETIVNRFPEYKNWSVINFAKRDKNGVNDDIYSFEGIYESIPEAYLYDTVEVIKYLASRKLIHGTAYNKGWSSGEIRGLPRDFKSDDFSERWAYAVDGHADWISAQLQKLGLITAQERIGVFSLPNPKKETCDIGPELKGQHFALVFKQELVNFLNFSRSNKPAIIGNKFVFLGKEIEFKGELERSSLELLLSKVNHIIPKGEFYEVRGLNNYQRSISLKNKTSVHEPLKKMFSKIEKKITNDPLLNEALIFISKKGYGIFINESGVEFFNDQPSLGKENIDFDYIEELELQYYNSNLY